MSLSPPAAPRAPTPIAALAAIALPLVALPVLVFPWLVDARDPTLYGSLTAGFVLGFAGAVLGVVASRKTKTLPIVAVVSGLLVMLLAILEIAFIALAETLKWH